MKENLMFCSLGNGISICDRNREEHCDYKTVAHIAYNRDITYYDKKMSQEAVDCIEGFAKYNNSSASQTQPYPVLRPVKFSKMDVNELEGLFKLLLEAYPQFAGAKLEVATFPACEKIIIYSTKEVCAFFGEYYGYMSTDFSPLENCWIFILYDQTNTNY